jgi:cystathionine gamma-synthase
VEDSSSTSSSRRVEEGIMDIPCGNPIPSDEHACSVSLPKWSDVVGYEEGNVAVTSKMVCGYPRFVFHPYVVRLMDAVVQLEEGQDVDCLLLPTYDAACRAHDFLWRAVVLQDTTTTSCTNLTNTSGFAALTSSDNALQPSPTTTHSATTTTTTPNPIIRIKDLKIPSNVHAVIFPAETKFAIAAKAYWQHTGEIVSSRRAEAALAELGWDTLTTTQSSSSPPTTSCPSSYPCLHPALVPTATTTTTTTPIHTLLKQRIASITNTCPESCVYLFPSGMAAIYSALRSARRNRLLLFQQQQLKPNKYYGGTSIVFGFPYLDTLKLCGRPEICPDGVEFFGHGDSSDLQKLEQMLCRRRSAQQNENNNDDAGVCALLTEFPSNPLLNCHDLSQLRNLADQYNFILIVDDVSYVNIEKKRMYVSSMILCHVHIF